MSDGDFIGRLKEGEMGGTKRNSAEIHNAVFRGALTHTPHCGRSNST